MLEALTAKLHTKIAFVPIFVDVSGKIESYNSISYGFSAWGGRNPRGMSLSDHSHGSPADLINQAHSLGKIWMQSVPFKVGFRQIHPQRGFDLFSSEVREDL